MISLSRYNVKVDFTVSLAMRVRSRLHRICIVSFEQQNMHPEHASYSGDIRCTLQMVVYSVEKGSHLHPVVKIERPFHFLRKSGHPVFIIRQAIIHSFIHSLIHHRQLLRRRSDLPFRGLARTRIHLQDKVNIILYYSANNL